MQRLVLDTENPNYKELRALAQKINQGALVIFPTDSVYAIGCLMTNRKGIEKICKVTQKKEKQAKMSIICPNISTISQYTIQIENPIFREMKRLLPGPYTFILNSNNYVQKYFKNNKEEIGVRIPENKIVSALLEQLEAPLISTSLSKIGNPEAYYIDPDKIFDDFQYEVDLLLDGGMGEEELTTVLDCTDGDISVLRMGKGIYQ